MISSFTPISYSYNTPIKILCRLCTNNITAMISSFTSISYSYITPIKILCRLCTSNNITMQWYPLLHLYHIAITHQSRFYVDYALIISLRWYPLSHLYHIAISHQSRFYVDYALLIISLCNDILVIWNSTLWIPLYKHLSTLWIPFTNSTPLYKHLSTLWTPYLKELACWGNSKQVILSVLSQTM